MTNTLQALIPHQIFDDAALYRHLEHLHLMLQHSEELFWMVVLHQLLVASLGDQQDHYALFFDVLEKCRMLQDNIRKSIDIILQLVSHRRSVLELQFDD